ncbi:MAG: ATP-binding protein [Gemmatimonadales bacterium]
MTSSARDVVMTPAGTDKPIGRSIESSLRILVVDDDAVDRLTVRRALAKSALAAATIEEAADGPSALAALTGSDAGRFDVVLLDYELPGDTGLDVLEEMKERGSTVPVVMLTGQSNPVTVAALMKAGAADFLTKDLVSPERLESVIRVAIRVARAERATRETSERLATTLESIADAVITVNVHGNVTYMNPAAEALTGWPLSEAVGQPFESVAFVVSAEWSDREEQPDLLHQHIAKVTRGLELNVRADMTLVSREGRQLYVDAIARQLRDAGGSGIGAVVALRDITERKRSETALASAHAQLKDQAEQLEQQVDEAAALTEELEQSNDQLLRANEEAEAARKEAEEANKAKSQFLANMSHELRTPLNAIGGYADLLIAEVRGPISDQQRADITRIQRNQHHLLSLINDILNFAKLEAGHVRLTPTTVAMDLILSGLEELIAPQLSQKELRYTYNGCGETYTVYADLERVQQILLNLLSNAAKFTPPGGEISIECEASTDRIDVLVRDTGVGIPPDKLEQIFEPFVQLDRGQSASSMGTGLGLAISRDLARAMGGDLEAKSELDAGSTFVLSLPTKQPAAR